MSGNEISSYCREIETYLCRKNDGHLIRVVGPSFDLVSRWAADGVPLKVAFRGIDRSFERYYRKGPRRRPLKIDFCEADVLDAFDEWKRATLAVAGHGSPVGGAERVPTARKGPSLPAHLERVVLRLSSARAAGTLGPAFDEVLDRIGGELDAARGEARGLRGEAREALIARLSALDNELVRLARESFGPGELDTFARAADDELRPFRATMNEEAYARVRGAAIDRLIRERLQLPIVRYSTLG